ncbi:GNAT family N-acetyltransferase [Paenibacillus sp. FSL W8-0187]|uniref:GNAT family N-acetyltransferase n=1 Tax=Paenibacillus sp. FSL W8-0187 TaxID=2921710 RepID=UPI0030DB8CCA
MLTTWDHRYAEAVIEFWNTEAVKDGYKELTPESLDRIFLSSPYLDPENTFLWMDNGQVKGFACGCTGDDLPLGQVAGYLTCIVIAEELQSDEIYSELLKAIENRFRTLGKKQSEVLFFNPMMLPWYIPDTPKHEHNNAPGVPIGSRLHSFLAAQGYIERATECAMYLDLSAFTYLDEMIAKEQKAASEGYAVELFDAAKHHGVTEMLQGFDNPLWQKEITASTEQGTPVVIAVRDDKAAGFAGPVIRQDNGRGYFAGIGVHPDHEGHGLGSVLFFKLCEAFKNIGTDYMSLYTGKDNPALRIYEKAGFRTVKYFAVMRKELSL